MGLSLSQVFRTNFTLLVGLGIPLFFLAVTFIGPPAPPRPTKTLTPQDRQFIAETVTSAIAAADARAPEPSYPEFLSLPTLTKLQLFASFSSYAERADGGAMIPHRRRGVLVVDGDVRRAYVLVHVARPLRDWEKVWVTIDDKGGHLHGSEGLRVPPDPQSMMQLFDIRRIPHDRNGVPETPSDWFSLLKPGARPVVDAFLSSEQPALLDVSIFYECVETDRFDGLMSRWPSHDYPCFLGLFQ